ncbi:hypothetical protein ABTZ03_34195 [Kitasatospora sp. NPDC096077]|uniref:hypothetical protein n=1 Tax=Kitasatospora sp. NPDC096077 TaxID=3155544 RepID=UPI003317489F
MRWLVLYARSRQVPLSAAAVVLMTSALWALTRPDGAGTEHQAQTVLVLSANVAACSIGLGGTDVVLERTAGLCWAPRRLAHALLIGVFAGAVVLAVRAAGAGLAPVEVIVRDCAGLVGLAALGTVLCGAAFAWTLPTAWLAVVLLTPAPNGTVGAVLHWLTFPPGTTASTGTALVLLGAGASVYAVVGPRR